MDEEKKYKLVVFDDLGENELFSVSDIGIDDEFQEKLLKELTAAKVTRPLLHEQSQEWFHPAGSIKLIRSNDKIFFCQDGMQVFEAIEHEIRLKVYASGPIYQNPKFLYKYKPSGPIVHIKFYEPARKVMRSITTTFGSWKNCFAKEHRDNLFWHRKMEDGTVKKIRIWLDGNSKLATDNGFAYSKDENGDWITLPAESYMFISSEKLFLTQETHLLTQIDRMCDIRNLIESFSHELSVNGKNSLKLLVEEILADFSEWKASASRLIAPIAFLVQHSGAGKSRMSVELLQELPGFYCLLRDSSSYPQTNEIFKVFKYAFLDYGWSCSQNFMSKNTKKPARVLILFAKMITIYLRQWHTYTMEAIADNATGESFELLAKRAYAQVGKCFRKNDLINCSFLEDEEFDKFIENGVEAQSGSEITAQVAKFIKTILDDPSKALPSVFQGDEVAIEAMKTILATLPFLIVLDEADFFDGGLTDYESKLQLLRECLSYLEPQTKLFFVAPCKNASRYFIHSSTFDPIVFKSNSATFMHEYPIEDVIITHKVITNSMFFKYLATLSAPVWGSISFGACITIAARMLKNPPPSKRPISQYERYDPDPDESCLLAIWMVRTGLIELPYAHKYAAELAKRHLGTVLETNPLRVTYPSDPILVMASRYIIGDIYPFGEKKQNFLFSALSQMYGGLNLAAGELTKIVGTMTCLIAIDGTPHSVRKKSYQIRAEYLVDELCSIMPKLEPLWKKKSYLLERTELVSRQVDYSTSDEYNNVVNVRDFLKTLLQKDEFAKIEGKLPKEILDGLINASHSVKVTREDGILKYKNLSFNPPKVSKTIDDAMLQLGLTIQCMFSVAGCGFGFDALIPVVLEDDSFTYLAIVFGFVDSIASAARIVLSIDMHATNPFEQQETRKRKLSQTEPEADANEIASTETTCASNMVALVTSHWSDGKQQFCIATRSLECFSRVFHSADVIKNVQQLLQNDSSTTK